MKSFAMKPLLFAFLLIFSCMSACNKEEESLLETHMLDSTYEVPSGFSGLYGFSEITFHSDGSLRIAVPELLTINPDLQVAEEVLSGNWELSGEQLDFTYEMLLLRPVFDALGAVTGYDEEVLSLSCTWAVTAFDAAWIEVAPVGEEDVTMRTPCFLPPGDPTRLSRK